MFSYTKNEIETYLKEKAYRSMKLSLDLDEPKSVQDKINWLIVNDDSNELKSRCADKILLHDYCQEKLGKDICVPILKVYDNPEEVDFNELPDRFVLKCNHGYAMNIIVDKNDNKLTTLKKLGLKTEDDCKKQLGKWLDINFGEINRQKHYALIKPRCYAEKYITDGSSSLKDYKFWCCNGKPMMIQVMTDRYTKNMHCNIYDTEWNWFHLGWSDFPEDPEHLDEKPKNLDLMLEYARKLSADFTFVRVDFYVVDDEVFLGELTFSPDGGIFKYKDRETELYWGSQINLGENRGVSVCITAYKSQDYIKECLDSVISQTWFKNHDNWEIIVGIDGCKETLKYVKTIMGNYKNLRVLMMKSNKGTYITSNTIMSSAKYDTLIRFDSDDVMHPNLVERLMENKGANDIVRFRFNNFKQGTDIYKPQSMFADGVFMIKKDTFMKFGGYRGWRCAADSEFRGRTQNFVTVYKHNELLFDRRVHEASLTRNEDTGLKSDYRKPLMEFARAELKNPPTDIKDAVIEMETNSYREVKLRYVKKKQQDEYMNGLTGTDRMTKFQKFQQDVEDGKIIKVPTGNGFIWKRIR